MNKVLIDFVGGMHGHFLESVMNGLNHVSPQLINDSPFRLSDRGTCRNKIYHPWSQRFCSDHFCDVDRLKKHQHMIDSATHCVSIVLQSDRSDLLRYVRVIFGRSIPPEWAQPGDFDQLHIDFYQKTSSKLFLPMRQRALEIDPDLDLSSTCPNINIHTLRNVLLHMLLPNSVLDKMQQAVPYYHNKIQHVFMFSWFYDQEKFMHGVSDLCDKFSINFDSRSQRVMELHQEFLLNNEFANDSSYQRCQWVLENLNSQCPMPSLDVLDQAWILSQLSLLTGKKIIYNVDQFFKTPSALYQYITQS